MQINRRDLMQSVIASAIVASLSPGTDGEAEPVTGLSAAPGAPTIAGRPRLYLSPASLRILTKRFHEDKPWAAALREEGQRLLTADFVPESVAEEGGGQQARYILPARQMAAMGLILGLLYQLTHEAQYAEKLYGAMAYYGKYTRWGGPGLADRVPPWHSELDTAEFCVGYACGYDMLHSYLSPDQRSQIAGDVIRLGILATFDDWLLPPKRFHSLDSMGHNWWAVCISGAGTAALALLGDEPQAEDWVRQVDSGFVEWFTYRGNILHNRIETLEVDGPSYEGVGYTSYEVSTYLRYLFAWKHVFSGSQSATEHYVKGIAEFFQHTSYPASSGSLTVNFDDCSLDADVSYTVLLLLACGVNDEYVHAYLRQTHHHANTRRHMGEPLLFYLKQQPQPAATPLPLSKVYPQMGWAMMRSSWDDNATLLAVKSGYTWNHAHADASTFLLMHHGSPLIIDSGTCSYGRPEYTSYYRQSQAHNVILLDDQGQPLDQIDIGAKFRGSIIKWCDGLGLRYLAADGTGPMSELFTRHYRHFLWIGNVILIFDDVGVSRDGNLQWLLHSEGETQSTGAGRLSLKNGDASAEYAMLYPTTKMEVRQGLVEQHPDQTIPYHVFSAATTNRRQRFISAIQLGPAAPVPMEVREGAEYLEVQFQHEGQTFLVYFNMRSIDGPYNMSSTITIDDWSTDAYMIAIGIDGDLSHADPSKAKLFHVVDGSFLRWRNNSVFESLSKGDCLWNQGSRMEAFTQGQENISYSIYARTKPKTLIWNNSEVEAAYDSRHNLLHLRSFPTPI